MKNNYFILVIFLQFAACSTDRSVVAPLRHQRCVASSIRNIEVRAALREAEGKFSQRFKLRKASYYFSAEALLNSSDLKSIEADLIRGPGFKKFVRVQVQLNSNGQRKLREQTEKLVSSGEAYYLGAFLNEEVLRVDRLFISLSIDRTVLLLEVPSASKPLKYFSEIMDRACALNGEIEKSRT